MNWCRCCSHEIISKRSSTPVYAWHSVRRRNMRACIASFRLATAFRLWQFVYSHFSLLAFHQHYHHRSSRVKLLPDGCCYFLKPRPRPSVTGFKQQHDARIWILCQQTSANRTEWPLSRCLRKSFCGPFRRRSNGESSIYAMPKTHLESDLAVCPNLFPNT